MGKHKLLGITGLKPYQPSWDRPLACPYFHYIFLFSYSISWDGPLACPYLLLHSSSLLCSSSVFADMREACPYKSDSSATS
jgi:hypothetical protein